MDKIIIPKTRRLEERVSTVDDCINFAAVLLGKSENLSFFFISIARPGFLLIGSPLPFAVLPLIL